MIRKRVLHFLQQEIEQKHIPGAVIHISHENEVILQEAIGNRVFHPEKARMNLNTVFDIASLTKIVATMPAILKLLEDGALCLDDRIGYFLPMFSKNGKDEITIKHLLTHTSGLPSHRPYYKESLNTGQILERIYEEEVKEPVGKKVIYSDLGLITLYRLIEEVTSERFELFVQREIVDPLEMSETTFNPTFAKERYAVTEYSDKFEAYKCGIVHDENAESMGGISGHAGLFSTVQDLANFASMVENNGIFRGKRIISEASLRLARSNYTSYDHEFRGLGWQLKSDSFAPCGDLFSASSYGHTGFTGTSMWLDPEIKLHVILLTNRVHFGRNDPILRLRPRLHNIVRAYL